jgi:ubiquinone/menaquinone biosynthesis C-methylase UbiE
LLNGVYLNSWAEYAKKRWKDLVFKPKFSEPMLSWFTKVKNKRMLDVGCGSGLYLYAFHLLGYKTYGIDIDPLVLSICRNNCKKHNFNPELKRADVCHIPYPDNYFDLVFSHGVIEHVKSYKKAVKEQVRVLKKNGLMFLSVPNRYSFFIINRVIQQMLCVWKTGRERYFTVREIKKMLGKNNLDLRKLWIQPYPKGTGRHPTVANFINFLDNPLHKLGLGGFFIFTLSKKL